MFGWGAKGPSPAEKQLGDVLFNDGLHVLSSFELNRIASLTYGDDCCEEIFEVLEQVQSRPMEHSPLTVQKSLVITKHILVYGSEKCVNSALRLQRGVEALVEFNTVLWAQKLQSAAAVLYRLKGGGVDRGFPVREAAKELWPLMTDVHKLRTLRNSSADPNSLVPVGSDRVAFLSDDVRHYLLKKRIQEQYKLQTRSNLASSDGGFGAGYASRDGKSVVGAAHGLEEMIKQAEIANRKFSDQGDAQKYEIPDLRELAALSRSEPIANGAIDAPSGGGNPQQGTTAVGDLLDFFHEPTPSQPAISLEGDLLGAGTAVTADLLGTGDAAPSLLFDPWVAQVQTPPSNGLLDFGSTTVPPDNPGTFTGVSDQLSLISLTEHSDDKPPATTQSVMVSNPVSASAMESASQPMMGRSVMGASVMSPNDDPFAALDSLPIPGAENLASKSQAKEAEDRLLGKTSSFELSSSVGLVNPPTIAEPVSSSILVPEVEYWVPNVANSTSASTAAAGDLADVGLQMPLQGIGVGMTALPMPPPSLSTLKVAPSYAGGVTIGAGDDDGFVMGGAMGTGLEPTAAAPAAPPPPPPPM